MENDILPPIQVFQAGKGEELVKSLISKMKEQANEPAPVRIARRPAVKRSDSNYGRSGKKEEGGKEGCKKTKKKPVQEEKATKEKGCEKDGQEKPRKNQLKNLKKSVKKTTKKKPKKSH